jgi:hypothetical protein
MDRTGKNSQPYQSVASIASPKRTPQRVVLERWLLIQLAAHGLVLSIYGGLLGLTALWVACVMLGEKGCSIESVGVFFGCCVLLLSAGCLVGRAWRRVRSLSGDVPITHRDLFYEWTHYGLGTLVCIGLFLYAMLSNSLFGSAFFIPPLAFCIYSLACQAKTVSLSVAARSEP